MHVCPQVTDFHAAGRRSVYAVLGAMLLIPFAGTSAASEPGECPASVVHVSQYTPTEPFPVDPFVYDSTIAFGWSSTHVRFDRTRGEVALSASSGGRFQASLRLVETFDVVGVAPGMPVEGKIEFRLDGWSEQSCGGSGCGVRFEGTLVVSADSTQVNANHIGPSIGSRPLAGTLTLPVRFVAGDPIEAQFFLDFGTGPGGGAHAEAIGSYRVTGLPSGVRAIACPGTDVTPVRRSTWGRLKGAYR